MCIRDRAYSCVGLSQHSSVTSKAKLKATGSTAKPHVGLLHHSANCVHYVTMWLDTLFTPVVTCELEQCTWLSCSPAREQSTFSMSSTVSICRGPLSEAIVGNKLTTCRLDISSADNRKQAYLFYFRLFNAPNKLYHNGAQQSL